MSVLQVGEMGVSDGRGVSERSVLNAIGLLEVTFPA